LPPGCTIGGEERDPDPVHFHVSEVAGGIVQKEQDRLVRDGADARNEDLAKPLASNRAIDPRLLLRKVGHGQRPPDGAGGLGRLANERDGDLVRPVAIRAHDDGEALLGLLAAARGLGLLARRKEGVPREEAVEEPDSSML